ncbi:MAG: GAF domain-containing protein, partial [Caldilineaceae bacterium]|nr:GAF domain-containing protein [Caldilineaceae bacterium]
QTMQMLTTENGFVQLITQLSLMLEAGNRPDETARQSLVMLCRLLPADAAQLWMAQDASANLTLLAEHTAADLTLIRQESAFVQSIPLDAARRSGKPQLVPPTADEAWLPQIRRPRHTMPVHPTDPATEEFVRCAALVFPLVANRRTIGWLIFYSGDAEHFAQLDPTILSVTTPLIALTLEHSMLYAQETQRRLEAETLQTTLAALASTMDSSEFLDNILVQLRKLLVYDSAAIFMFTEGELEIVAASGFPDPRSLIGHRYPEPGPIFDELRRTGEPIFIPDVHLDPRFRFWEETHYIRSWLGVPIVLQGTTIGYITLDNRNQNSYGPADVSIARSFASQAAIMIEKSRLLADSQRRTDELTALIELAGALQVEDDEQRIAEIVVAHVCRALDVPYGVIAVPVQAISRLRVVAGLGMPPSLQQRRLPIDRSIFGLVYKTGEAILTEDLLTDPHVSPEAANDLRTLRANVSAMPAATAPLRSGQKTMGVIGVADFAPRRLTETDLLALSAMAEIAGGAIQRAQFLATLEQRVEERTLELEEANSQLQALDRLKSEFIANLNHDLRTPLTNIKLYSSLLAKGNSQNSDRHLDVLRRETDRLHHLIESMLDLSRLDATRIQGIIRRTRVDLGDLVRLVLINEAFLIESHDLTVDFTPPPEPLLLEANRAQLIQVITNLLTNAVHYNRPTGKITINVGRQQDQLFLMIRDTGMGIDPSELPLIFDRFYRGVQAREKSLPGNGLGLAIVEDIVTLHNGHILVDSTVGVGSTFEVWLPLKQDNRRVMPLPAVSESAAEEADSINDRT